MNYKRTTQVPNLIFDQYLPQLTDAELKLLLVVIRQTYGWIDKKTGKRKTKDRITHNQFIQKTGLSRRVITKTIQSLINKKLLRATDHKGNVLETPGDRQGRSVIFYSCLQPVYRTTSTCAESKPRLVHQSAYNKTNYNKLTKTKLRTLVNTYSRLVHIGKYLNH